MDAEQPDGSLYGKKKNKLLRYEKAGIVVFEIYNALKAWRGTRDSNSRAVISCRRFSGPFRYDHFGNPSYVDVNHTVAPSTRFELVTS